MNRILRKINRYLPAFSMVMIPVALIALAVNIGYILSPAFADFFNLSVSQHVRAFTASVSGIFAFSLAEFIVLASPVIAVCIIVIATRKASRGSRHFIRVIAGLISILLFLYSLFVFSFGAGYRTTAIDKKLGIPRAQVTAEELADTMDHVVAKLNDLADEVIYILGKGSVRPWDHNTAVKHCLDSYEKLAGEYDFLPVLTAPVKQLISSEFMTYTHISGMYTFFTGESNLNTNYPYYVNVYTIAHEMAHQRGIARENEANFMAYLVCINSDDPYMQYAGYLSMYDYLASPLYSASPSLYSKSVQKLDQRVRYDLKCYSEFFDKYRDNAAAEVSNAVNNTYLVLQGTEGAKSYGMVVDLAVAYHKADTASAEN